MIEPEEYNEYGELIIKPKELPLLKNSQGRQLIGYSLHRIHETKDLFDSDCTYCEQAAERWRQRQSWWRDEDEDIIDS